MNIKLEEIDINSGIDGLEVLKEISNDDEIYGESPVPKEINEDLYKGFLLISEEESNLDDTYRYWVTLDDKKIGYANIRRNLDEDARRIGGNIGIVLLKKYRNKGLGKIVLSMLLDTSYEKGIEDVLITTSPDNTPMRNLCESMGGSLEDIDGHCHYLFKKKKIHKK